MRTFYYRVTTNFGDYMNSWLWPELFPGLTDKHPERVLVGIGSLIKSDLSRVPGRKVIFGTGSGYGPMPRPEEVADWDVYCVRGPLTARLLRLDPDKAVVDGAWLVDQLSDMRYQPGTREGIVFLPHWTTDLYANWRAPCRAAGIRYISPFEDSKAVFRAISQAKLAIVESLHGGIVADYYRVPWIPVASGERVLAFKWQDFVQSLGLDYRPIALPRTDSLERLLGQPETPWSGGIDYLTVPSVPDLDKAIYAPAIPDSMAYRMRIRLKGLIRPVRGAAVAALNAGRQHPPLSTAFSSRAARLGDLLNRIAEEPTWLSADATRAAKLDRLGSLAAQFRNDFG